MVYTFKKSLHPPPLYFSGVDGKTSAGSKEGVPMRVTCVRYMGCALILMVPDRRPAK